MSCAPWASQSLKTLQSGGKRHHFLGTQESSQIRQTIRQGQDKISQKPKTIALTLGKDPGTFDMEDKDELAQGEGRAWAKYKQVSN